MASALKTLTLVSSDGKNYQVPEADAALSLTIKHMIDDGCADDPIPLTEVKSDTLSKIVEYLHAHSPNNNKNSAEDKNKFDVAFFADADLPVLVHYAFAANYLNIRGLLDLSTKKIADLIQHKSVEKIREIFDIDNDLTPEEEAELRNQYHELYER